MKYGLMVCLLACISVCVSAQQPVGAAESRKMVAEVCAAAAEMCYVADGRFEARAEAFTCPWDVAAGILLVQNAGGRVTDFSGGDSCYSGREVVASNGKVHDFLLNLLG